ncbi:MAG TPA: sulfite reductase subunit alpha [Opitutaceae bacterium]
MTVAHAPAGTGFNKDHPFPSRVFENRLLSGPGSAKETRHFVISVAGSGLNYKPGDSLGIYPSNPVADVEEILSRLRADGSESVQLPRSTEVVTLREALTSKLSLAQPTRKAVEFLAGKTLDPTEREKLERLLVHGAELEVFLKDHEFADLLSEFPSAPVTPQELVALMRKLMPRLYSIASTPRVFGDDVHLTVAIVRYETNGRKRGGVCSTFLADRVQPRETPVPVFVSHSHFGLPKSGDADLIMVGPGTGIAPFRAFLHDRRATGAKGRNWLFFGDQHRATDFLYADEFVAFQREGFLTRLDLAFSRDQAHKIYVQDRMRESGAELWAWLEGGAYFCVCGDAKRMAKDVDAELHAIARQHGAMDEATAISWVKHLKKDRRYVRDVY